MKILGIRISAFYHDSAACLVRDGHIVAAHEKRFSRKKHDARFPKEAVQYGLKEGRIFAWKHSLRRALRQAPRKVRALRGPQSFVRAMPHLTQQVVLRRLSLARDPASFASKRGATVAFSPAVTNLACCVGESSLRLSQQYSQFTSYESTMNCGMQLAVVSFAQ